jgi:hypothetical protein
MTTEPTPAPAAAPAAAPVEEAHGDDHVHVYETSGFREGNRPVPRWAVIVFLALLVFWVVYIAVNWHGQPGTAAFK